MTDRAAASLPIPGTARSWWLREALAAEGDPAAAARAARPRHRRRRDHRRRVHRPLDGVVPARAQPRGAHRAARAGHLRRRAERPERRLPPRLVGGRADARPSLRRRGGGGDRACRGRGRRRHRRVVCNARRRRLVREARLPARQRLSRPAERLGWDAGELARLGLADALMPLPAAEVQRVCASPAFGDGLLMPSAASVQPARLARGLRRVLLERGVQIAEGTRALRVDGRGPLRVVTAGGSVTAEHVVLAINAWAAGWPGFRTRLLAWGSDIVLTEPIPDRLAELGWTGGELLSDSRFTISYFRTTADGRIAFGGGVGSAGFGGRIGPSFTHDRRAIARVVANLDHLLPMLRDVRLTDAWGGPIDITGERFPEVGSARGGPAPLRPRLRRQRRRAVTARGPHPRCAGRRARGPGAPPRRSSAAASPSCRRSRCATWVRGSSARRSSARTTRGTRDAVRHSSSARSPACHASSATSSATDAGRRAQRL